MRRRKTAEINVFSTSAIDLFASGMGVFLIMMVVLLPRIQNISKEETIMEAEEVKKLTDELDKLSQIESQFLKGLMQYTKNLGEVESKIRLLAASGQSARSKVEGVQNLAQTLSSTQSIMKDIVDMIQAVKEREAELEEKLKTNDRNIASVQEELAKEKEKSEYTQQLLQAELKAQSQFVAVMLQWTTEDHDLDLRLTDPSGKLHAFKLGDVKSVMNDARRGPGAEMWFLQNPAPGNYKIEAYFHGQYGNLKPSPIVFSIVDRKQVKVINDQVLKTEGELKTLATFNVDGTGKINRIR